MILYNSHNIMYSHTLYIYVFLYLQDVCILFLLITFLIISDVVAYVCSIICCDDAFVKNMSSMVPEQ